MGNVIVICTNDYPKEVLSAGTSEREAQAYVDLLNVRDKERCDKAGMSDKTRTHYHYHVCPIVTIAARKKELGI
jgi:hypothetical protein